MGVLPNALALLTAIATNAQNITAGPFMAAIPTPPSTAWAPRTPTAPTPTAPSIRSRPPPPAPPFPRRNQRGMGPQETFLSPGALSISADPAGQIYTRLWWSSWCLMFVRRDHPEKSTDLVAVGWTFHVQAGERPEQRPDPRRELRARFWRTSTSGSAYSAVIRDGRSPVVQRASTAVRRHGRSTNDARPRRSVLCPRPRPRPIASGASCSIAP